MSSVISHDQLIINDNNHNFIYTVILHVHTVVIVQSDLMIWLDTLSVASFKEINRKSVEKCKLRLRKKIEY